MGALVSGVVFTALVVSNGAERLATAGASV
jgi:hypothetical protein